MTNEELRTNAKTAFSAFNACFLKDHSFHTYPWETAEMIELYEDAYSVFGGMHLKYTVLGMVNKFLDDLGEDWGGRNDFYDDIAWIILAVLRAYKISNNPYYLTAVKKNFDALWDAAWDEKKLDGGAYFCKSGRAKTACSNLPLSIAASMLGVILEDETYWEKAKKAVDWVAANLYDAETGMVKDAVNFRIGDGFPDYDEPLIDDSQFTYNYGTFIGAATAIYEHYGDAKYLQYADDAAVYLHQILYDGGVMDNETGTQDQVGFKGVMARYLRRYADKYNRPEYTEWLKLNAESAWEHRNRFSLMDTRLGTQTSDDMVHGNDGRVRAFNFSSALSIMIHSIEREEV